MQYDVVAQSYLSSAEPARSVPFVFMGSPYLLQVYSYQTKTNFDQLLSSCKLVFRKPLSFGYFTEKTRFLVEQHSFRFQHQLIYTQRLLSR